MTDSTRFAASDFDPPTVPLTGGRVDQYLDDAGAWVRCIIDGPNAQGGYRVELPNAQRTMHYDVPRDRVRWNTDPDLLSCYSDHEHDITYRGVCEMCGSRDVQVIGHVAGDMERVKGMNPVDACRLVVRTGSAKLFDGVMLDLFSASAVVQVYDAVNDKHQANLRGMSLPSAVSFCFRLIERMKK